MTPSRGVAACICNDAAMKCPDCGGGTIVPRSRNTGDRVIRLRVCRVNSQHRFETIEQRPVARLETVAVRRSGDGKLAVGGFNWDRFVRDVRAAVLKLMTEAEVVDVCTRAQRFLEVQLPFLIRDLTRAEQAERPGLRGWIADADISHAVEQQLRGNKRRIAHVMYALSIRGRADRDGRTGWLSAKDVLHWLYSEPNYPDLRMEDGRGERVPTDAWYPSMATPEPTMVIKRDGRRTRFALPQFESSVRNAMLGRPEAADVSAHVVQWVLFGVQGQTEVHASQLAVGVLDCLRRVDDIAYLRWAAVAKGMSSVTQFRDEARGLLLTPSRRLHFDISASPWRPGLLRPATAHETDA